MSTLNYLTSGLVQLNTPSSTINGISSAVQSATNQNANTTQPDCNIYPVGNTINPVDTIYHEQTVLMVNSTVNQNANTVTAGYFDPVSGKMCNWNNWNFDLSSCSYLNGTMSTSSMLGDDISLFSNLQPIVNATGKHNIDITNGTTVANIQNPYVSTSSSIPAGLFFSLTQQPYFSSSGSVYGNGAGTTVPTAANINPGYSNYNSDNYLFTSNYYIQQKNEILIIELLFTVSNTDATAYSAGTTKGVPNLSVIVKNKVLTQNALASLSSDSSDLSKVKTYTAGPIPLVFMTPGTTFNSQYSYSSILNNVPVVIAPGYTKLYATFPVAYVPAVSGGMSGYYINQSGYVFNGDPNSSIPYVPIFNLSTAATNPPYVAGLTSLSATGITNGHFVVGVAFSTTVNTYTNYSSITAEVLIRNIWKSPIAIYNTYNQFSVNDMATKQVVLLFGRNVTGGTFLVLNTGTPLSVISSYAVTSLRNFVSIMRAIINLFDGSVSIVDYFINPSTVAQVNQMGSYNINVLILQPLMDGAIHNPPTVATCPGMWYLMLNSKNSFNMAVDPSEQMVFGQQIGYNYFSLPNSVLCATGNCMYMMNGLNTLSDDQGDLFGNSLSLGLNVINSNSYYILIILPEAQFTPTINTAMMNSLTVYSTPNSLFYVMVTPNSGSQFSPASSSTVTASTKSTTSSTSTSALTYQPTYSIQKVILSVSNNKLF
jgi:hypothetical protein